MESTSTGGKPPTTPWILKTRTPFAVDYWRVASMKVISGLPFRMLSSLQRLCATSFRQHGQMLSIKSHKSYFNQVPENQIRYAFLVLSSSQSTSQRNLLREDCVQQRQAYIP